jgi:uncharacterized protein DUF3810
LNQTLAVIVNDFLAVNRFSERISVKSAAALVALAVICAVAPVPPHIVERLYSQGVYTAIQPVLTSVSNLLPVALLDLLILLALAGWFLLARRDLMRASQEGWAPAVAQIAVRTLAWSAAAYLLFLAAWGFNYRRVRLVDKLEFSADAATGDSARALATRVVEQLNDLYRPAHDIGWASPGTIDPALVDAFNRAVRDTVTDHAIVAGRPKHSLLDWYFRRAAISGMTDPFFLETLVAGDVLPFERPMVVAHEWSHLAGINHEGEANFVAWIACVRSTPSHRYSAWLLLYEEVLPSIGRRDRAALAATLGPGPREDLQAIRDRFDRNVSPRLFAVGWKVYDSYLKANRIESGAASYAEVVRLILGVRFTGEWTPERRQ